MKLSYCCHWFVTILIAAAPGMGFARTCFLADFDAGLDARYALGDGKAAYSPWIKTGDVRRVDGRFGQGVWVGRKVPAQALHYATANNFNAKQGTVEFWFRPDWHMNFYEEDGPSSPRDQALVLLLATAGSASSFFISKAQYDFFTFVYTRDFKETARAGIMGRFWKKGEWVFVAASWDEIEGRLFLNGRLVAVSERWEIGEVGSSVGLGSHGITTDLGAWGTFDDFRISDTLKYVSSFSIPQKPLTLEQDSPATNLAPSLAADEEACLTRRRTLFLTDFRNGLRATFAAGSREGIANRPLQILRESGSPCLRLNRASDGVGDTLAYALKDNLNPYLGSVTLRVCMGDSANLPAILFDATEIICVKAAPGNDRLRTGMRLMIMPGPCLEWQVLEAGRILASVRSAPIALAPNAWTRLGFAWASSAITLWQDGKQLTRKQGNPLPTRMGRYIFIGSNSQGENTFTGFIQNVAIQL